MFELEKSKCGPMTLKYNSRYIHSKYDPVKEGELFAKNNLQLINKPISVLYGIGLGYHIKEIYKLLKKESILYVFEYNEELITYCKEVNPEIFDYKNIKIINGENKEFYNRLSQKLEMVNDIMVHKPSLEVIHENNSKLFNLINDFNNVKQFSKVDTLHQEIGKENTEYNIGKNYKCIDELIRFLRDKKKPFVITSSGPSLDYEVESLKQHQNEFVIICVGSSLRTLMVNNIIPDVIVIIDPKEIVKKQFEGYENLDVPLSFPASASRWAIDSYNGPKYIFDTKNEEIHIELGGTVAISAIDIAIKSNAKEVLLLGQDLAYLGEKSHTDTYKKIYGFKDHEKNGHRMRRVMGVNGVELETCDGYLVFKHKIEQLILKNDEIKFINCSSGAVIDGTYYMKLEDYLKNI